MWNQILGAISRDNFLKQLIYLGFIVFVLKVFALPFVQITDSDAVSRIFSAAEWAANPHLIVKGIWGPIHYYLLGTPLMLWNNAVYCPMLVTIIFSVAIIFPVYFFVKQGFSARSAFWVCASLVFCPILFRNSFLPLSETPFLFFVACSLLFLSVGLSQKNSTYFFAAGISITIASGLRYEAWLLMAVWFLLLCWKTSFRAAIVFGLAAGLFPVFWIYQGYIQTGDLLQGISGNYQWIELSGYNESVNWREQLMRVYFFPFSFFIAVGPITIWLIIRKIKETKIPQMAFLNRRYIWFLPFVIIAIFVEYNAISGKLFLQHRFVGTLVLLGAPLWAYCFEKTTSSKLPIISILVTFILSFVWNTDGIKPFPRVSAETIEISKDIEQESTPQTKVILDFWDWEGTFYVALKSYNSSQKIPIIISGAKNDSLGWGKIHNTLAQSTTWVIAIRENSNLHQKLTIEPNRLIIKEENLFFSTTELYNKNGLIILKHSI